MAGKKEGGITSKKGPMIGDIKEGKKQRRAKGRKEGREEGRHIRLYRWRNVL